MLRWQLANPGNEDGPEVPMAGRRVWSVFLDLTATRSVGMGPAPISFGEIEAWSRLNREPIRPFELTMLRALDAAFLKAAAERSEEGDKPAVSARPFSIELFDAWFAQ
ncbi:hypothetical protein ACM42_18235 [Bradyrhizobium sp. CCBAU 25338]|nr:hypothetical protein [Bradyrhizobium sp. CCBAU 25338]